MPFPELLFKVIEGWNIQSCVVYLLENSSNILYDVAQNTRTLLGSFVFWAATEMCLRTFRRESKAAVM